MAQDFIELFRAARRRFPTQQAFAKAIGIGVERVNRLLNEKGEYPQLSPWNCLRLADVAGENPSEVLRLAKKEKFASLIERLYGPAIEPKDRQAREVMQLWEGIETDDARAIVMGVLRRFSGVSGEPVREEGADPSATPPGRAAGVQHG